MAATHFNGPVVSANGLDGADVADASGSGITDGTGTVITTNITKVGNIVNTQIFIDVTGLQSSTTDLDIIGSGASAAYLTQIDYYRALSYWRLAAISQGVYRRYREGVMGDSSNVELSFFKDRLHRLAKAALELLK